MLRYPCLVLDHDDTVVRSEATVNYPAFLQALRELRPGQTVSLRDFSLWTFQEGFFEMCANHFGFREPEFQRQFAIWLDYVMTHVPPCFPGIRPILQRQREEGGLICVVSHSAKENISRDYQTHFGLQPDRIYGWELGPEKRKPAPYPLDDIMAGFGLEPGDLLVVDDLNTGYAMAKARGVDFAWAGWSRDNMPEIAAAMAPIADYAFASPDELAKFLFAPASAGLTGVV